MWISENSRLSDMNYKIECLSSQVSKKTKVILKFLLLDFILGN